jgi:GMP synthase (glutamine-hydrolysing)
MFAAPGPRISAAPFRFAPRCGASGERGEQNLEIAAQSVTTGSTDSIAVASMQPPVLIVLHQEHSTPGRIGHALKSRGYRLDVRRPRFDDPLPETLADHAGAVVFGGPQSANDTESFIRREIDWIGVPLSEKKPFLGICLGAQMLARHLGTRVDLHPEGQVECGYYPIRPTETGLAVCGRWPDHVYQWHREGFELPAGSALLAEGDAFPVQAFRHGPCAYGIQFHPEVTHAMMCRWTTRGHERMGIARCTTSPSAPGSPIFSTTGPATRRRTYAPPRAAGSIRSRPRRLNPANKQPYRRACWTSDPPATGTGWLTAATMELASSLAMH